MTILHLVTFVFFRDLGKLSKKNLIVTLINQLYQTENQEPINQN